MASATSARIGKATVRPTDATAISNARFVAGEHAALPEAVREDQPARSQVLDRNLSRCTPRTPTPGDRTGHRRSASFAAASSIDSLPRASARLTTTRSTCWSRTMQGMSATVPITPGLISDDADAMRDRDRRNRRARRRAPDAARTAHARVPPTPRSVPTIRRRSAGPTRSGEPLERQPPARDERRRRTSTRARTRRGR